MALEFRFARLFKAAKFEWQKSFMTLEDLC